MIRRRHGKGTETDINAALDPPKAFRSEQRTGIVGHSDGKGTIMQQAHRAEENQVNLPWETKQRIFCCHSN